MPCQWIKLPGGGVAHVSTSPQRKKFCACGAPCTKLCDFDVSPPGQVTHRKTCDKPLCDKCAIHAGPDTDYCRPHAELPKQQRGEAA